MSKKTPKKVKKICCVYSRVDNYGFVLNLAYPAQNT